MAVGWSLSCSVSGSPWTYARRWEANGRLEVLGILLVPPPCWLLTLINGTPSWNLAARPGLSLSMSGRFSWNDGSVPEALAVVQRLGPKSPGRVSESLSVGPARVPQTSPDQLFVGKSCCPIFVSSRLQLREQPLETNLRQKAKPLL